MPPGGAAQLVSIQLLEIAEGNPEYWECWEKTGFCLGMCAARLILQTVARQAENAVTGTLPIG